MMKFSDCCCRDMAMNGERVGWKYCPWCGTNRKKVFKLKENRFTIKNDGDIVGIEHVNGDNKGFMWVAKEEIEEIP